MINFQHFWQQRGFANILLLPFAALFRIATTLRRHWQQRLTTALPPLPPVIVVGNIVVGGSGKTPVVIALARQLAARGYRPGIISRGYGGNYQQETLLLTDEHHWQQVGDEPLLMQRQTQLPVCVGRKRRFAAARLAECGCDVIISDDGLQHYTLPRNVEICVVDAAYRLGNGWLLPAGPLRESPARIAACDLCLLIDSDENKGENSSATMVNVARQLRGFYALNAPDKPLSADFFAGKNVAAIAGIARPDAFFNTLEKNGIPLQQRHALADHSEYTATKLAQITADVILMTEKDAVKYAATDPRLYALKIECTLPEQVLKDIEQRLRSIASAPLQ